ncbi:MAG: type VII toxin-antitoxin system HepT family RNase toxin [Desulfitobacteriaceae bacterium]
MVDKDKIEQRLVKLEQAMRKLKEIALQSWEQYNNSEALRDRAERNLQVAAQACIDIANHIIADRGYRTPQGYAESFSVLAEEGIISDRLADKMKMVAGFRNILVHDYLEIDNKIVYSSLNHLDDFKQFASNVYKLL